MNNTQYSYVIAGFLVAIMYIALCNIAAAVLSWKIFSQLGWGPASRCLTIGFIASAFAWSAFTGANEVMVDLAPEARLGITMLGLLVKAVGMTFIVVGFWMLYQATSRLRVERASRDEQQPPSGL